MEEYRNLQPHRISNDTRLSISNDVHNQTIIRLGTAFCIKDDIGNIIANRNFNEYIQACTVQIHEEIQDFLTSHLSSIELIGISDELFEEEMICWQQIPSLLDANEITLLDAFKRQSHFYNILCQNSNFASSAHNQIISNQAFFRTVKIGDARIKLRNLNETYLLIDNLEQQLNEMCNGRINRLIYKYPSAEDLIEAWIRKRITFEEGSSKNLSKMDFHVNLNLYISSILEIFNYLKLDYFQLEP